ncbi:ALP1-like protein [Tanacetum coccineum]|uniref:ALP1-like protein n=1 Tax=Tanacetum coccineum TaxID=301880 RepID=A0ABQ4X9J4_9ASTR
MGEQTARNCLDDFSECIIDLYMSKYLRKPTLADVENVYDAHENIHGFSEMLENIDFVASHDLWIWHAFIGVVGAKNGINVLDNSSLFEDLLDDIAHVALFVVNGVGFENEYYLADGIYP